MVENPTPQIPPVLHKPCKDPMIFFSNFFCNVKACVFTAMLNIRMLNAKRQIEITKVNIVSVNPIHARAMAFVAKAKHMGMRLSNLATNHPENGKPINDTNGMASKTVPNSASFKLKYVLIVGIRDAQVAKLNPEIKKKILKKNRCLFFNIINHP